MRCSAAAAHSPCCVDRRLHDLGQLALGHLGIGLVLERRDLAGDAEEGGHRARARIAHELQQGIQAQRLVGHPHVGVATAPPETGGIRASSSPGSSGCSASAYSRLTAITTGSAGGQRRHLAQRVADARALGELELDLVGPRALAEPGEQSHGHLHWPQGIPCWAAS